MKGVYMGRGLYGKNEGWESRTSAALLSERIMDNQVVEGDHVANLRGMAQGCDWKGYEAYVAVLRTDGWSQNRIDSMTRRATFGLF
jgi:hypothetical protein